MILLDHLSRRKTRPIACVSATKTNCYLEQTWLKKTNQVKERQNDKDKMENRAENFLISWLKTFICPDNLQAWVLNSIKVKTWVLSLPTQILLQLALQTASTDPHDVDDVLTADRPIVFVVSSAPGRDGGCAGAATADCWEEFDWYYHTIRHVSRVLSQLTLVLPEGGEGGDAGNVLLVRAGGHVAQRLKFPLGAVITHVAVEDRGWGGKGLNNVLFWILVVIIVSLKLGLLYFRTLYTIILHENRSSFPATIPFGGLR